MGIINTKEEICKMEMFKLFNSEIIFSRKTNKTYIKIKEEFFRTMILLQNTKSTKNQWKIYQSITNFNLMTNCYLCSTKNMTRVLINLRRKIYSVSITKNQKIFYKLKFGNWKSQKKKSQGNLLTNNPLLIS